MAEIPHGVLENAARRLASVRNTIRRERIDHRVASALDALELIIELGNAAEE